MVSRSVAQRGFTRLYDNIRQRNIPSVASLFIHVVLRSHKSAWSDYIDFRDYLNNNADVAKEYEDLKIRLVENNKGEINREKYMDGKRDFIQKVLGKAKIK